MNRSLCLSNDELQYFVFDYLKDSKNFDVINDKNFPKQFEDFIRKNLFPIENIVLSERKILGPGKYNRAELLSVGVQSSSATLSDALEIFCINQSLISKIEKVFFLVLHLKSNILVDLFAREICSGYQQAIDLEKYFKSTPDFCPNCSFVDAADKYYWFDKIIPFLPLWITLVGKK
jgi:hypothetical protein